VPGDFHSPAALATSEKKTHCRCEFFETSAVVAYVSVGEWFLFCSCLFNKGRSDLAMTPSAPKSAFGVRAGMDANGIRNRPGGSPKRFYSPGR
jgi:hypothetical protein